MKLLAINIALVILHIHFSKMEVIQKLSHEDKLPDNKTCGGDVGSSATEKPLETESCSQDAAIMATEIARESAEVAKAALEAQDGAAKNAAHLVKLQLANKAMASAQIAICLFEGKLGIVDSMTKEIQVAEATVAQLSASMETSRENAQAAAAAVKLGNNHTAMVTAMVADVKSTLVDLDSLIEEAQEDLEEKKKIVEKAKAHYACVCKELAKVKSQYQKVKAAASRAATAAMEAKQKVGNTSKTKGKCAD